MVPNQDLEDGNGVEEVELVNNTPEVVAVVKVPPKSLPAIFSVSPAEITNDEFTVRPPAAEHFDEVPLIERIL